MKKLHLSNEIKYVLEKFKECGVEAYIVGGAVRDYLMGKSPDDFDVTTAALPHKVKEIFAEQKIIETGIKHGTVTVIVNGVSIEITTYRTDVGYSDNRHPDKVVFSGNLQDDLSRRDFTVNAICYNPVTGFTDLFGGTQDIKNKILRTVGNAETRFTEDALRILRAVRFISVLNFNPDPSTEKAVFECAELLKNVSAERIFVEFKKMLSGVARKSVCSKYFSVLQKAIPPLENCLYNENPDNLNIADKKENKKPCENNNLPDFSALEKCNIADIPLLLTVFFICACKKEPLETAEKSLNFLKCDNKTKSGVLSLIKMFLNVVPKTQVQIKTALYEFGEETVLKSFDVFYAFDLLPEKEKEEQKSQTAQIIESKDCYKISMLDIKGGNIKKAGYSGEEIGEKLKELLFAVINGKVNNNRKDLIEHLKSKQSF